QTITDSLAKGLGLAQNWGVVIDDVIPGGPAEAGGLKIADIIVRADGRLIGTLPAFTAALYLHPLDQSLKLEVLRGTERKTLLSAALRQIKPHDPVVLQVERGGGFQWLAFEME